MNELELRLSLQTVGPLLPQLIWGGRVVDGEKRDRICAELGIVLPQRRLHTREEACTALWLVHPERAIVVAGTERVLELARLCGAQPIEIAKVLERMRPTKAKEKRAPRQTQGQKRQQISIWVEPQFKHYLQRAQEVTGLNMSEALTQAGWRYIQQALPRAATEGERRAPSGESVKPRRRARR